MGNRRKRITGGNTRRCDSTRECFKTDRWKKSGCPCSIRSLERRSVFGDSFILKFVQDYSEKMKKLDFMNENYGIERYV